MLHLRLGQIIQPSRRNIDPRSHQPPVRRHPRHRRHKRQFSRRTKLPAPSTQHQQRVSRSNHVTDVNMPPERVKSTRLMLTLLQAMKIGVSHQYVASIAKYIAFHRPSTRVPCFLASKGYARSERIQQERSMSLQALETIDQQAIPVKERRIPKRIAEAIRLITTGECTTQKAAAERVGITPGHLCETLKKPHVQVFIEREARKTISNGLMRASARVNELVDATSEHVSFEASKHVLAIAGIKPTADAQVSVNIDIKAGYVIDLTDKPQPVIIEHNGT